MSAYSENSSRTAHTLIRGTHEKSCDYTVTTVTLMGLKTEEHKFFETKEHNFKFRDDMKAKSKSELAMAAGVSLDTLRKWMRANQVELEAMGLDLKDRVLPPKVVKFLADRYCIDVDD